MARACVLAGAFVLLGAGAGAGAGAAAQQAPDGRRSGYADMGAATQAMQRDDAQNPGMLWVHQGEALWRRALGPHERACQGCHGDASRSMREVAARYPAFDAAAARPLSLRARVNACRVRHQGVPALAPESEALLALEAWLAFQARGAPIAPPDDARLADWRARGMARWSRRVGQLNLSCAQCHDERAGQRLAGSRIPQGHATGYPIYRLEWQSLGSIERRIRNCLTGVRAEPFDPGSEAMVELELYMATRSRAMLVETPAVRP